MRGSFATGLFALALLGADAEAQAPEDFSVRGPVFVAIRSADADRAAAWYVRVLGLRELRRLETPDGRATIRLLGRGGLTVEVIGTAEGSAPSDGAYGLFKAGFFVDDVEALHGWLRASGVDLDARVVVDETLRARTFVFRDLDGNRLQAFERCGSRCG